ncbi:MAG TPA: histidinol-phosphate transaminase [Sphingomicrobium sp.]|jgi:histidinol-phosphate aminotransferase/imidazoleglycerol-phosphate dehydratase/histidinol-phosphatase|nr:histidinol-phosphate transaminase [Sphingomicrobium sp.]
MSVALRLARAAIRDLPPVDIAGAPLPDTIRLDANENPYAALVAGQPTINRYPEPQPATLRARLAALYGVAPERLWVTRGSDDAIDLLIRTFCEAGQDSIGIVEPTFSAYAQFARVQGARVVTARLTDDFRFDAGAVISAMAAEAPKLLFLCTPNNPTGTPVEPDDARRIAAALTDTIVVADEAYAEFSETADLADEADGNLVVLRTLSKAYGLAGARIGCAIGSADLIDLLSRVSPPYPLPGPSIAAAVAALGAERMPLHRQRIADLLAERERLLSLLAGADGVASVRAGGNFLFLEVDNPDALARTLSSAGVRVRFRPNAAPGGVRVTVGTPIENEALLAAFGLSLTTTGRQASLVRDTQETQIAVSVDLDRAGPRSIESGIAFYDHMLDQVASHGGFALTLACSGDTHIDGHHSIEDVAIALGGALRQALGDKQGIGRFGFALPMDEAEGQVLIDLSGRPFARFDGRFDSDKIGDLPTQMVPHIFRSLADALGAAIHVRVEGENDHHKVEAAFKAFGRAFRQAIAQTGDGLPSTKGLL